ncbi:MAG: hypothetical protein ACM3TN_21125 [Alphaproteobacteria bacterium]
MMTTLLKAIVLWLVLVVLAILNGTLRQEVLVPMLGDSVGLSISGVTLSVAIFLVSWFALPWYGPLPSSHYWIIGLVWLLMTVLFEFGFGHFIAHKSWPQLLQAYNVSQGNLWIVVLIATVVSPWLAARLKGAI